MFANCHQVPVGAITAFGSESRVLRESPFQPMREPLSVPLEEMIEITKVTIDVVEVAAKLEDFSRTRFIPGLHSVVVELCHPAFLPTCVSKTQTQFFQAGC